MNWLQRFLSSEDRFSKAMSAFCAVLFGIFVLTGDHLGMVICLVGFLYEEHQRQIAALRRDIRAKPMWHGGENDR